MIDNIELEDWAEGIELHEGNSFSSIVYPNPANEEVTLKFDNPEPSDFILRVYNNTGQSVLETKINGQDCFRVDLSGYDAGVYFYRLSCLKNGKSGGGAFIKE